MKELKYKISPFKTKIDSQTPCSRNSYGEQSSRCSFSPQGSSNSLSNWASLTGSRSSASRSHDWSLMPFFWGTLPDRNERYSCWRWSNFTRSRLQRCASSHGLSVAQLRTLTINANLHIVNPWKSLNAVWQWPPSLYPWVCKLSTANTVALCNSWEVQLATGSPSWGNSLHRII